MVNASSAVGTSRDSQPNNRRSKLLNDGRFGDLRLSTLICWRRTRISASSRALERTSLISAYAINMRKLIIGYQHHPIRRMIASQIEFPVGTGDGDHMIADEMGEVAV